MGGRRRWAPCLVGAALLLGGPAAAGDETPVAPDRVFELLGFDAAQRRRVYDGEIVTREFEERSSKQLALAMAMIVPVPMDELIADLRAGAVLEHDRTVLAHGEIHDAASAAHDLLALSFPADEIDALLAARAGSKFNLSADEIGRFAALRGRFPGGGCSKDPACAGAVADTYRAVLASRFAAYRERGLNGIAAYAREGGKTSDAAAELRAAAEGLRPLTTGSAALLEAFINYPSEDASAFEHHFLWLEQSVQDRRTPILSHHLLRVEPDMAFLAERQFYVGHSYNALQVLSGLLPSDGKTLVFYLNRTSTDQVAGPLEATRHDAGRRVMAKEVRAHFEQLRASVTRN